MCCADVFWDVNEALVSLPLSGGTEAEGRYKLLSPSAALPFLSLSRNASDVIEQAGVKRNPFVPPPLPPWLQAVFPGKTQAHLHHFAASWSAQIII